ncbi:hypothetical protein PCL_03953 [Purpureocillium lilacinum]|uniref:Uncharacterized protein n=1 Tax=Purpureocillium lilacinum TaxID=33203 RepID=A0A2U3EQI2_PURLI|nr:hypothetical protein Purlil1_3503 [Purpureocillium lilacinum]PWI76759.1 hypothetical protein PCL_03953 [Purpureocillium lilacinum]
MNQRGHRHDPPLATRKDARNQGSTDWLRLARHDLARRLGDWSRTATASGGVARHRVMRLSTDRPPSQQHIHPYPCRYELSGVGPALQRHAMPPAANAKRTWRRFEKSADGGTTVMVLRLPRREAPRAGPFQAADGDQDGDGHGDGDMGSGVRSSTNLIPQPRNERSVFRRSKPSGLTRAGRPPSSGSHSSHANVAQGSRAAAVAAKPSMASAVGPRQTGQPARTPVIDRQAKNLAFRLSAPLPVPAPQFSPHDGAKGRYCGADSTPVSTSRELRNDSLEICLRATPSRRREALISGRPLRAQLCHIPASRHPSSGEKCCCLRIVGCAVHSRQGGGGRLHCRAPDGLLAATLDGPPALWQRETWLPAPQTGTTNTRPPQARCVGRPARASSVSRLAHDHARCPKATVGLPHDMGWSVSRSDGRTNPGPQQRPDEAGREDLASRPVALCPGPPKLQPPA